MERDRHGCDPAQVTHVTAAITGGITVQQFLPLPCPRRSQSIAVTWHRSEVTNHQNQILDRLSLAQETDHTMFGIVTVDPLEPAGIAVELMKRGIVAIQMIEIADPVFQSLMHRIV